MFVTLLIVLMSDPGQPQLFGVLDQFKTVVECRKAIENWDAPPNVKERLSCMEVKKPVEI